LNFELLESSSPTKFKSCSTFVGYTVAFDVVVSEMRFVSVIVCAPAHTCIVTSLCVCLSAHERKNSEQKST